MNKKSGSAGNLVAPIAPQSAHEADQADPVAMAAIKVEQMANKVGKFGTEKFKPHNAPAKMDQVEVTEKTTWIEIKLVDEDGEPVAGERYEVKLPDGQTVASGTLDEKGFARVEGFAPGQCQVTFPDLDESVWGAG